MNTPSLFKQLVIKTLDKVVKSKQLRFDNHPKYKLITKHLLLLIY